jgi:membrane-associated phospholipid phosphatase
MDEHIALKQRMIMVVGLLIFILTCYLGSQKLVLAFFDVGQHDLLLPGEEKIPFMPFSILVYSLEYLLPIWLFVMISKREYILKIIIAFVAMVIIHVFFYFSFPVEYVLRPHLSADTMGYYFISTLYEMDAPINTFPSMHVSIAFLTFFIIRKYRPHLQWIGFLVAIIISTSTILIKQHYILDVVSGVMLAWLVYYVCFSKDIKLLDKFVRP